LVLIDQLFSRQILDSRGQPTLETTIVLTDGLKTKASVPSGASRGTHEALELRDKDYSHYHGLGVLRAVENVNKIISPRLHKMNPLEQAKIDQVLLELDQTTNKAHLGANSVLSVSLAVSRVASLLRKIPLYLYLNELFHRCEALNEHEEKINLPQAKEKTSLPIPIFNLINGGKHADNLLKFQEYWIVPHGILSEKERIRAAVEIDWTLKKNLIEKKYAVALGDEGGFTPNLPSDSEALKLLKEAIASAGFDLGSQISLGLDLAASTFYSNGKYELPLENFSGTGDQLAVFYSQLIEQYPISYLEDAFSEDDWESWTNFAKKVGQDGRLIGDDLIVTNRTRLLKAHEEKALNSVLVKPNQIGTLTETLQFIKVAKHFDYTIFASHRSGETNDDFIVDLAVGVGADYLKAGAPVRGERVAKYNRLMEIEEEIS